MRALKEVGLYWGGDLDKELIKETVGVTVVKNLIKNKETNTKEERRQIIDAFYSVSDAVMLVMDVEKFKSSWGIEEICPLGNAFNGCVHIYYVGSGQPNLMPLRIRISKDEIMKRIKEEKQNIIEELESLFPGYKLKKMFNQSPEEEVFKRFKDVISSIEKKLAEKENGERIEILQYEELIRRLEIMFKKEML